MHDPNGVPVQALDPSADRDRLEIIHFATAEMQRQAIGELVECGMLNFTSYRDKEWLVRTPIGASSATAACGSNGRRSTPNMPSPSPNRQAVDLTPLEPHAAKVKLRTGLVLPETRRKTVSLPRAAFVPVIQAEVGTPVPLLVHRYRLLLPIAQIIRESMSAARRSIIATVSDIDAIRDALTGWRRAMPRCYAAFLRIWPWETR